MNNLIGMIPNCLVDMKGVKLNESIDEGNSLSPTYAPAHVLGQNVSVGVTNWNQEHVA